MKKKVIELLFYPYRIKCFKYMSKIELKYIVWVNKFNDVLVVLTHAAVGDVKN